MQVSALVDKKLDAEYSLMLSFPDIPVCSILQGQESNIVVKKLIEILLNFAPNLASLCSRSGEFKISNFTVVNSSFLLLFPTGAYRTFIRLYDFNDYNIVTINITTTLVRWSSFSHNRTQWKSNNSHIKLQKCLSHLILIASGWEFM